MFKLVTLFHASLFEPRQTEQGLPKARTRKSEGGAADGVSKDARGSFDLEGSGISLVAESK
jgi:hypothetical protein